MITYILQKAVYAEMIGLSKDKKPVPSPNGSLFIEMDTGKEFRFDAEHNAWIEPGAVAAKPKAAKKAEKTEK